MIQAEDGIRDRNVTGVQTCALPIWGSARDGRRTAYRLAFVGRSPAACRWGWRGLAAIPPSPCHPLGRNTTSARSRCCYRPTASQPRSEERRVGKECRSGWRPYDSSRRRHTRSKRDWSSDVCSSDLGKRSGWPANGVSACLRGKVTGSLPLGLAWPSSNSAVAVPPSWPEYHICKIALLLSTHGIATEIGRASCRERV